MPADPPGAEPVVTQIPTDELKRILTDRFARQVASDAGKRIWRPVTLFGLPGIVLAATLVWQLLDTAITNKISAQLQGSQARLEQSVSGTMNTLFTARSEVARLEARDAINQAFQSQQGAALGSALRSATEADQFKQDLARIVNAALAGAWAQESPRLRENFLAALTQDTAFREAFARDVEQALGNAQAVPRIIAGALEASLLRRRAEDGGHAVPLSLLASMDQAKANEVVRALLERSRGEGHGDVALAALAAVSFAGLQPDRAAPSQMLTAALDVWSAHCADARCGADQPLGAAMVAFLRRGRELAGTDRDAWVTALRLWHEQLVSTPDARARDASLGLVPRALGGIGSPDAIAVLTRWAVAEDAELALSTTQAIGTLPPDTLPDRERLALIRTLWSRLAEGEGERAAVAEAAWMALGQISRGEADPHLGPFAAEAALARAYLAGQDRRGELASWVNAPPTRRSPIAQPPRAPCAVAGATATDDGSDRQRRLRADLCALAALLRPKAASAEWTQLRPPLLQRDRVALLGLLWALAVDGVGETAGMPPESRYAPLHDLLLSASPPPPAFHLAGMLVLRSASDRQAWQALESLEGTMGQGTAGDPATFLAATRWLYRAGADETGWFAERLRGLSAERRAAVLEAILRSVLPATPGAQTAAMQRLAPAITRSPTTGMLNAMSLAHAVDPGRVEAAAERAGVLRALRTLAEGSGRAGVARSTALRLQEALLSGTGWAEAAAALVSAPVPAGMPVSLEPVHAGRFGRLRLADGSTLTYQAPEGGPPLALFHPATNETQLVAPRTSWRVRNAGVPEDGWLFRVAAGAGGLLLAPAEPRPLALRPADAADVPALERGVVYRVASLARNAEGWARIPGVARGERLLVTSYGHTREVDTVIVLARDGQNLEEDDDGGGGLNSLLRWTADQAGELRLMLRNIGEPGGFDLMVTREE